MNDLTPFDYERLVIAHLLVYPDAAKYVFPDLTHDKFLFSKEGRLDGAKDHLRIWQAMSYVYHVDKVPITTTMVLKRLNEEKGNSEYLHYLSSLETALHGYYRVREFEPQWLMAYATEVDKSGVMYRAAVKSYKLAKMLESPESFAKEVALVPDVTDWLKTYIDDVSVITTPKAEGYKHISTSVDKTKQLVNRIYSGEQLMLLPVGMPSVHLPLGKLVILMGESNAGKSVVAHQWALGTAIGLFMSEIKGCVAVNSLEEDEESLTMKLGAMLAGVDLHNFKYGTGITPSEKVRLEKALDYIACLPIYLDPTNLLASSVMDYRVSGLHASSLGPVWHLSVDYMELFNMSAEDVDSKEQALDKIVHKGFGISRQTGANVVFISQVSQGNSGNYKARIAGPDGTRYSKAIRHSADLIYEWWNPVEMKRSGIDFVVPDYLNGDQPWLLTSKHRGGPKYDPQAYGWEPHNQRIFDLSLNQSGNTGTVLFTHPMPSFEEVMDGF